MRKLKSYIVFIYNFFDYFYFFLFETVFFCFHISSPKLVLASFFYNFSSRNIFQITLIFQDLVRFRVANKLQFFAALYLRAVLDLQTSKDVNQKGSKHVKFGKVRKQRWNSGKVNAKMCLFRELFSTIHETSQKTIAD